MFRLIPSNFGHAKSCWDIFKHQILFQRWLDAILCIGYLIFCTHTTSVTTFACLQEFSLCIASSALNYLLCVHRARMGAQSSAGRGLVNLRPRERIGQSYPAGRDAHKIHPCRVEQIVSVKINPSLVMMRECPILHRLERKRFPDTLKSKPSTHTHLCIPIFWLLDISTYRNWCYAIVLGG